MLNWHCATVCHSSLQHKLRTGHLVSFFALGVNERTCDIFSYAYGASYICARAPTGLGLLKRM